MTAADEVLVQLRTPEPGAQHAADALSYLRQRFGLSAEPLFSGADDRSLLNWYTVAVPAGADAEDVAAALRARPDVGAAYVKPPAELP